MKLTNQEIISLLNGLMEIEEKLMPVALAYKINCNNQVLTEKYRVYLKTLQPIKEDKEKVKELLKLETEVDLRLIPLKELEEASLTLTPLTLQNLLPMLTEAQDG